MDISRHFITLGNRQIHYRRAGAGPPVVLLHQSPTSSRDCETLMRKLLPQHCVIAPDMPGYGASDPLPDTQLSIEKLADNVAVFMDALGIGVAGIYGYHTGASVATAFARRHPQRVSVSVALGLMCPTTKERDELLAQYLPDFVPRWDGSHLAWLWSRVRDQSVFFPWYARSAQCRVSMDGAAPAAIQANLPDWLRSAERYASAYSAAFRYRPEIDLPHIRTPHFILGFPADPLFAHLDRLPAMPDGIDVIRSATSAAAYDVACECLGRLPSSSRAPPATAAQPVSMRSWQDYVVLAGVQLRVLRAGHSGAPVLLQHGAQGSLNALRGLVEEMGAERSVCAVELAGHGESDALADPGDTNIVGMAQLLRQAAISLGMSEAHLVGFEAGAAIQTALALHGGIDVRGISLVAPLDVASQPSLQQRLLASYQEPAAPDFFGGHLLRCWHMARDHLLFFPWYERRRDCAGAGDPWLTAGFVQQAMTGSLLAGASGFAARRAEILYPLAAQLAALPCQAYCSAPRWNPRFGHSQSVALAAGRPFVEVPETSDASRALIV